MKWKFAKESFTTKNNVKHGGIKRRVKLMQVKFELTFKKPGAQFCEIKKIKRGHSNGNYYKENIFQFC